MSQGYIIRIKKAFYHPDKGTMPLVGIWHGSTEGLKHWLLEQDYPLHRYEIAPFTQAGLMLKLTHNPNTPDVITDVLGTDIDEYASYDHNGQWQDLATY